MKKDEFLESLRRGLSGLPTSDVGERLNFYSEMIDDRMEEGLSEEEAVAEIGSVYSVVTQILSETPFSTLVKEKVKPERKHSTVALILLILGSPVWFSLLIAVFVVVITLYAAVWSVIITLFAVMGAFAVTTLAITVFGIFAAGMGTAAHSAMLGTALCLAGLTIFMFYISKAAAKGVIFLSKKLP